MDVIAIGKLSVPYIGNIGLVPRCYRPVVIINVYLLRTARGDLGRQLSAYPLRALRGYTIECNCYLMLDIFFNLCITIIR